MNKKHPQNATISCTISQKARRNLNQLKMDMEVGQDEALNLLLMGDYKAMKAFKEIIVEKY